MGAVRFPRSSTWASLRFPRGGHVSSATPPNRDPADIISVPPCAIPIRTTDAGILHSHFFFSLEYFDIFFVV